jgi:hypothetical protein
VTDYQPTLGTTWEAPGASKANLVSVPGYDVSLLRVEWLDPKDINPVTVKSLVATRDRRVDITTRVKRAFNHSPIREDQT